MGEDFVKLCQMNAAMARIEGYKAEMLVAASRGESVPDYSPDIYREAEFIDSLWRG